MNKDLCVLALLEKSRKSSWKLSSFDPRGNACSCSHPNAARDSNLSRTGSSPARKIRHGRGSRGVPSHQSRRHDAGGAQGYQPGRMIDQRLKDRLSAPGLRGAETTLRPSRRSPPALHGTASAKIPCAINIGPASRGSWPQMSGHTVGVCGPLPLEQRLVCVAQRPFALAVPSSARRERRDERSERSGCRGHDRSFLPAAAAAVGGAALGARAGAIRSGSIAPYPSCRPHTTHDCLVPPTCGAVMGRVDTCVCMCSAVFVGPARPSVSSAVPRPVV